MTRAQLAQAGSKRTLVHRQSVLLPAFGAAACGFQRDTAGSPTGSAPTPVAACGWRPWRLSGRAVGDGDQLPSSQKLLVARTIDCDVVDQPVLAPDDQITTRAAAMAAYLNRSPAAPAGSGQLQASPALDDLQDVRIMVCLENSTQEGRELCVRFI
jgi:hypothetical protein